MAREAKTQNAEFLRGAAELSLKFLSFCDFPSRFIFQLSKMIETDSNFYL